MISVCLANPPNSLTATPMASMVLVYTRSLVEAGGPAAVWNSKGTKNDTVKVELQLGPAPGSTFKYCGDK